VHSAAPRGQTYSAHAGLSPQPSRWRKLLFTVNLADRRADLLVKHIDALRDAVRRVRTRVPFRVDAPDHMHCLWSWPEGDADFPAAGARLRLRSPARCRPLNRDRRLGPTAANAGFGSTTIGSTTRDQQDFAHHFDHLHFNPVKHGLVEHPADWPCSTFRRCVARGRYPTDWAGAVGEPAHAGERPCRRRAYRSKAECAALFRPTLAATGADQWQSLSSNGHSRKF
jgi:putative transposase